VNFDALRQEALAPTLPAAREDGAAVLGLHAGAKSELLFAGALRGLVGAFHGSFGKRGRRLAASFRLSTSQPNNLPPPPDRANQWPRALTEIRKPDIFPPLNEKFPSTQLKTW
jgi:hypothetical protein